MSASAPADADDMRGYYMRRYLGHRLTLIGGGALILAAFVAVASSGSPGAGGVAALGVLLLVVLIVWLVARSRAEADFFRAYADGRGLALNTERAQLPPLTELLRKGDERYAEQTLAGKLPGGLDGTLALYTYEEEDRDSQGNEQTTYYHYTIAITDAPEMAALIRDLACHQRAGFRFMDSAEDVFRRRQRVELESVTADKRYEIFAGPDDDLNRVRQVFEPSFILWLADDAPEDFAFELSGGVLVCDVKGHKKSSAELDGLCEAAARVAVRLREEASEVG